MNNGKNSAKAESVDDDENDEDEEDGSEYSYEEYDSGSEYDSDEYTEVSDDEEEESKSICWLGIRPCIVAPVTDNIIVSLSRWRYQEAVR